MRETAAILTAYDTLQEKGESAVLATVVHVEGSSYRAAGARMLVDELGFMTGAISGGCLEGDALRKALLALEQNQTKLVTYDTSDEDDAVIGAQLGCNGIIQVLFEPIDPADRLNPIELLRQADAESQPVALVSVFDLIKTNEQIGTCLLIDQDGIINGDLSNDKLLSAIKRDAERARTNRIHHFGKYTHESGSHHAFIEIVEPPPHLVLIGAGNDARILADMAGSLGWKRTVADGRPTHATDRRFRSCQVVVANPGEVLKKINITEKSVFVLMTHNYLYDYEVLKLLLSEEIIPYIGILGPNKKHNRMMDELAGEGIELSASQKEKLFAPVGLQIGAETPAEIALSILAEIQAVLTGSEVKHLRDLDGSIHKKELYKFKTAVL